MEFWNWKVPTAQLTVRAWNCARLATFLLWLQMQLEYLQIWLAQFVAAHQWQIQCCYVTNVIMDITCTASRRHWNKCQLVSGAARNVRGLKYTFVCSSIISCEHLQRVDHQIKDSVKIE